MKRLPLAALLVFAAIPAFAQKSPVPDLLKRALSPPASIEAFAYDFEDVTRGGSKDKQGAQTTRGHVDPSRKKGDRVTITFAERTGDNDKVDLRKIDERYERGASGDIFCDTFSKEDVTDVADKGLIAAGRLFAFTPKAEGSVDGEMKNIMKKMTVEAVVDQASAILRGFTATLTKPHNVMLIAEVKSASMKVDCLPAPNGRAYAVRREFDVSGSGMGQSFSSKTIQIISNIQRVGVSGG